MIEDHWTDRYVGLPFVPKGRDRAGVDCWGLIRLVYRERLGIDLPDYLECYDNPSDGRTIARLMEDKGGWSEIPAGCARDYDGILLRMSGLPSHVGLVAGPGLMLHVTRGINISVERLEGRLWKNRVLGFYRHASV